MLAAAQILQDQRVRGSAQVARTAWRRCTSPRIYRIRSGQAFWCELTGDPQFYIKLLDWMGEFPARHRQEYEKAYGKAVNRLTREFLLDFATPEGDIDWAKLLEFNSGVPPRHRGQMAALSDKEFALEDEA